MNYFLVFFMSITLPIFSCFSADDEQTSGKNPKGADSTICSLALEEKIVGDLIDSVQNIPARQKITILLQVNRNLPNRTVRECNQTIFKLAERLGFLRNITIFSEALSPDRIILTISDAAQLPNILEIIALDAVTSAQMQSRIWLM